MNSQDREAIVILTALGWRIRSTGEYRQAVKHFQQACLIGAPLVVDGVAGPKTIAQLRDCNRRRKAGQPTASAHFSFTEFRCKCGGKYSSCARIWITRATVQLAEEYRRDLGRGFGIVSGCRCPGHNKAVRGATRSQHMAGKALDFPPAESVKWFESHGLHKGGIGANPARLVRHADTGPKRGWSYST